jgi:anaerobic selenocysteine-containing dehydrogenase
MTNGDRVVRTSCRSCHGVCQVLVHLEGEGRILRITGHPDSPTSRGYICSKGRTALELVHQPDRILTSLS